MFYNIQEKELNLSSGAMTYLCFGKGTCPLIMIQGLNTRGISGSGVMLAWMYRMFAKDYRVYFFDRPAHLSENTTIEALTDSLIEAMETLSIQSAMVLGVSQGGMIAQNLAIKRPDLVKKLVLAVTLSRNNPTVEAVIQYWIDLVNKEQFKELTWDMTKKMYTDAYLKGMKLFLPLLTLINKPKDKERFIALAKSCLSCKTYDQLEKIQCETLVIGAKEDKIVTAEASLEIAQRLGAELVLYEKYGHAVYEEARDFNQRIYEFFAK